MIQRVADWHGEQAATFYSVYLRFRREEDLTAAMRHFAIHDRLRRAA